MDGKCKKGFCLILLSSFLLFIFGCSTMKNILTWPKSLFSRSPGLKDKEVTQFISTVRPYQGNPESHYLLACYYQERGRHKEALEEFKKVLLIDPNHVKAYNGLGISHDHLGDFPQAIESYEQALKLNPDLDYVQNNLGYSYLLQENFEKAITAFQKAIKLNGEDGRFRNNLGLAYALKGQLDLAMNEFKLAGDEAKANFNIAQFYYKRGFYNLAKIHYSTALTFHHSLTRARTGLEAVNALAGIFQPAAEQAKEGKLGAPEQPVTEVIQAEEWTTPGQLITGRTEPDELTGQVQPPNGKAETEKSFILNPLPEKSSLTSLKKVEIEISNGNGVNQMAKRVGDYLKEKGLKVTRLTNTPGFKHAETRIFYQKGYYGAANHVGDQLPVPGRMVALKRFDRPNIKVKVIIGEDLIPYDKVFGGGRQS